VSLFKFFKKRKKVPQDESKIPSIEQKDFSDAALEVFKPLLVSKGFSLTKNEVEKYFTYITFRKGTLYIKITGDTFPTSVPWGFNVILGTGDSETFLEYDWNSIGLWQLKLTIDPTANETDYGFRYDGKVSMDQLIKAKDDLLKYGNSFLHGDLTLFLETRKSLNKKRDPYRISSLDEDDNRQIRHDDQSLEMKKKFS
jgi:hypothetical protein